MKRQAKSFLYMLKFIYLRKGCNENKCTQISYSFSHRFKFNHGHKKRKDSLKKRTVLLIFSLELEISGMAVQIMH